MSQALFNQVKHLSEQLQALQNAYVELSERVLTLEADKAEQSTELDIDTLTPKRRGRPPRVQA
jgi:uncharacterized protein YaaN involved in tellurite resistance